MRKFIVSGCAIWCLCLCQILVKGQDVTKFQVPIETASKELKLAGMGGLNAPQVSTIDWNGDGNEDLFIFDRVGDVVIPLVHQGGVSSTDYKLDWSYKEGLPDFRFWVLVRDYNKDGLGDFFTAAIQSGVPGITVYKAVKNGDQIDYVKQFFDGRDYLLVPAGGGDTNLYVSWEDIPSIDDMDDDGDLDVVCFDPGGSRIALYKNLSVENGWGADSLEFIVGDDCWGKVLESELNESLFLSDNPEDCSTGGLTGPVIQTRHSGSTVTTFDQNGDGPKEALIGDITSKAIVFGKNGGTIENAWINEQDPNWPSYDTEVDLSFFGAGYHLDVDHDNLPDILIGSNTRSFGEKIDVLWYYKNIGTIDNQVFELQQKNLFLDEMLDFGSETNPTFADVNGDGLMDLVTAAFLSNPVTLDRVPSLKLLLNVGTANAPRYKLTDEDYLGLSSLASIPTWSLTPEFGDLDNDGDIDLIVGDNDGELFYYENTAGAGAVMSFASVQYPYMGIDVGGSSAPTIFDVDQDGLNDLVVGERNANFGDMGNCGSLTFFKNIGTVGNASFDPSFDAPNTNCFGQVILNAVPGIPVYAKPRIFIVDGEQVIFVGDDKGKIRRYSGVENDLYGAFNIIDENYGDLKDGFRAGFDLADIDQDGKLEMVVGNIRGGLTFYNTELSAISTAIKPVDINLTDKIDIVPNPANQFFRLKHVPSLEIQKVSLVDFTGKMIWEIDYRQGISFDIRNLANGIYSAVISTSKGISSEKIIVLH